MFNNICDTANQVLLKFGLSWSEHGEGRCKKQMRKKFLFVILKSWRFTNILANEAEKPVAVFLDDGSVVELTRQKRQYGFGGFG